jgi:CIC family chloride channel protein
MPTSPTSGTPSRRLFPAFEVPQVLRALVRARESALIALGALIGIVAGLVVVSMSFAVGWFHAVLFDLERGSRLSAQTHIDPWLALSVPTAGGMLFGFGLWLLLRRRPAREIDPIEANALHGGRMSLRGSLIVALQTVWSSGVGASVGLEAGYTQLASGIASSIGRAFHLRRRDLRVLVGCGAAGAIAGAFGAPLAGAFYAFELVIASYSAASLAPVGMAALMGYLVTGLFEPPAFGIGTLYVSHIRGADLAVAAVVGIAAAGVGIALMRGVAMCEELLNRLRIRPVLRPTLGGLLVGAMAIVSPEILSSGHGALHSISTMLSNPLSSILLLFLLKSAASVISLGTGFRGGLFFASLLIGALGGQIFAGAAAFVFPASDLDPRVYSIIGLGAVSVSVIGGPLTMTFIALEITGDFWLTAAVLVAIIVAAQVTREAFGYSFATWRFHLRGESIRSAADIGWIRELTVRRMMRQDVRTVSAHTTVARFRLVFPPGSTGQVVALDEKKNYAGMISVAEAHAPELDETRPVRDIVHLVDTVLLPTMTVKEAAALFDKAEAEALAVVEAPDNRQVIGLLTEAYTLRRYTGELEQRRQDLLGE